MSSADTNLLVEEIWQSQPQTIIINTYNLSQSQELLKRLESYPTLHLIVVNAYSNLITIYENPNSTESLSNGEKANLSAKLFG